MCVGGVDVGIEENWEQQHDLRELLTVPPERPSRVWKAVKWGAGALLALLLSLLVIRTGAVLIALVRS